MKTNSSTYYAKNSQAGFSLVDVMVGMVISLIAIIIIFQVFEVSENVKRTTTGGGDAQQNGVAGLFALERSLREAGYGLNSNDVNPTPLVLNANAAQVPDSLTVTSRQFWNYGPFSPDVLAFPSAVPPVPTTETFSVALSAQGQPQLVSSVNGPLAEGIVQLKAQYGTDANGNGVVDAGEWGTAVPANPMTVLAVRLALVARSSEGGKPLAGVCNITPVSPSWAGGVLDLTGNFGLPPVANGMDWKCYRYKTFEVTVPLRNVIWKP